jgi:hypothetical protein
VTRAPGGRAAVVALLAVVALVLAFQPLRSAWWAGGDWEAVYPTGGLSLMRGNQPGFEVHPGYPIQQTLGVAFTLGSLVASPGDTREERAVAFYRDFDSTRPYARTLAVALYAGSALLVLVVLARLFRSWTFGFAGAVLFLAAPGLINLAVAISPDSLLGALSITSVALLVAWFRARRPEALVGAAAAIGFAVTVKIHAVGLLAPLALALLLRPPAAADWDAIATSASAFVSRRRLLLGGAAAVWLAATAYFTATGPRPVGLELAWTAAALAAAAAAVAVLAAKRRTRLLGAIAAALVAGAVVPNLLYLGALPGLFADMWRNSTGAGELPIDPFAGALAPPRPWLPLVAVAGVGLWLALRDRDREALLWAAAAVAMGVLAAARLGLLHYWAPAIALSVPLALATAARVPRPQLAAAALLALAVLPFYRGLEPTYDRKRATDEVEAANRWVTERLGADEVALTTELSSDAFWISQVANWTVDPPELDYRVVPVEVGPGAAVGDTFRARDWLRTHPRTVRYVVTRSDPSAALRGAGVTGTPEPVRDLVFRVRS